MKLKSNMSTHQFSIYTPKEKSLLTDINLKPLAFLGLVFCFFILNEFIDLPEEENYRYILLNILWISIIIIGFYYFTLFKVDNTITDIQLSKKLSFHSDYIEIDNEKINLEAVENLTFNLKDFKINTTEDLILRKRFPYNNISFGINNSLHIKLINQDSRKIQFQRITEKELLKVRKELIHYYQKDKISLLNITEALHITKYEDIQQFIDDYPQL